MSDAAESTYVSPEDELDFSGDGIQTQSLDFLIVDAGIIDVDQGQKWEATFEPADGQEIDGLFNNQVRDNGFLSHDERDDLVRIGRSVLKRLGQAAGLGASFSVAALKGCVVNAQLSEDDGGFARMRRYKPSRG